MEMENDENQLQRSKHIKLSSPPPPPSESTNNDQNHTDDPRNFARSYQLEALEKAMKENTIVFLETGSGKTLIAIMLLRSYANLLKKPSQFISVFLVPTVVLVTQQAEAVEMHTDLKVGKYWGEMGVDFWDAVTWKEELEKNEVLVMTPQILLDALRHSFFKLEIIKLLILDECHNARGRSPYTCIMTEFYHKQLRTQSGVLPRIFGMTASPIKSKGSSSSNNYAKQILELESLLNSKVYTVSNESVLAEFIPFPTMKLKFYKHLDIPHSIFLSLIDHLKKLKFKHVESLKELQLNEHAKETASKKVSKLFNTFVYCLTDLGIWLALKAAESLSCTETHCLLWGHEKDGTIEGILRSFSQDAFQAFCSYIPSEGHIGRCMSADVEAGLLTAKVNCLVESLMEYRMIKDLRCIIFVQRVITAIALKAMLTELLEENCWNTTYMAGNGSGMQFQTRQTQMSMIEDFRKGIVNIIVATQILEEGLDVQNCNLVIRFDLAATVCSFIQSRGRARMQGSDYLLILKCEDASTLSKVDNYLASGDIMRQESLRHAALPCEPFESATYDELFYCVESTGAVVTLSSSIALIYYYCSRLPSDGYFSPAPRFIMENDLCTLHLPKSCPIQIVTVQGQKDVRKIVCLDACKKLHQIGSLTNNLLPEIIVEEAAAQENGNIPYEDELVNYFPEEFVSHKAFSNEWEVYHCYSIVLEQNFDYDVQLRDITLAINCGRKSDLEDLAFHLQVSRGLISVNMVYTGTIQLSAEQVLMARRFQVTLLKVLSDHNLSEWKNAIDGLDQETHPMVNYLLLPSVHCDQKSSVIDWCCVKSALFPSSGHGCCGNQHESSPEDHLHRIRMKDDEVCRSMLVNSLVFTPHNGRLYCITNILDDINVNSPMNGKKHSTYKEFYKSRHGLNLQYERESLLYGRQIFKIRNRLQRGSYDKEKEHSNAFVELPPELCVIVMSPLTISTLYSFSLVPSIMHRLESIFLALSLKKMQSDHCTQNVTVPTMKVLEAITTKKCQEEFSLESLETLGDSFLKYAVCQQLFQANKHHHEGLLSIKKSRMVSNNTLCKLGCDRKLQGFIRNECFDPKQWVIPGDTSSCTEMNEISIFTSGKIYIMGTRHMKSKVVADVVEALVGAYLSTCGEVAALLFLDWLGMKVVLGHELPSKLPFLVQPERYVNIKHLESLLNYSFHEPSLLVEALTHGSYQLEEVRSCYQRLEFLGDSVLDHLITVYLYNKYPRMSPGLITDLRSASVNNDCYARAAVQAKLHKYILHASSKLHKQMAMFVSEFEQSSSASTFGWGSCTDLPKVLGDIIESLAGAILVDSGYNKDTVWKCMKPLLEPLVTPDTIKLHPVRELRELCQRKGFKYVQCVSYVNANAAFTVEVKAEGILYRHTCTGANKKTAKKLACQAVLESLKASLSGL